VAVIDQINTRVDPALKAEYDATAAALGVPASSIFREILEKALPEWRLRAEEAARKREGYLGSVPQHALETSIQNYMRAIARSETLKLAPHTLFGADSKALWQLLTWIWGEETEHDAKARKKLAAWLESLNIKANVTTFVPPVTVSRPDPKPVKDYPRRKND
jgi:hypothetical protein